MFYKIKDKFYIKTASYYKEIEFNGKEFLPSQKENTKLYEISDKEVTPYTVEDAIKEVKTKKINPKILEEE